MRICLKNVAHSGCSVNSVIIITSLCNIICEVDFPERARMPSLSLSHVDTGGLGISVKVWIQGMGRGLKSTIIVVWQLIHFLGECWCERLTQ